MYPPKSVRGLAPSLVAVLSLAVPQAQAGSIVSAPDALAKAQGRELTLIDIRTPAEWRQTGVAAGALPLDMTRQTFVDEVLKAVKGDKGAPIALICRSGNRSTHAQEALEDLGFTQVYNVKEGMAGSGAGPGWLGRGLPVEPCKGC